MKKITKGYIIGFISAIMILTSINVFAIGINKALDVILNKINISINGDVIAKAGENYKLETGESIPYSILYKGTTYLPIRKVAELVDKEVSWNNETNTAGINDKGYIDETKDEEILDKLKTFQDVNIESTVRQQLGKLTGELTKVDLESIKSLWVANIQITSLKGIEKLTNLEKLELTSTGIEDISYLKNLKKLKILGLFGNNIPNLDIIGSLTNLESLNVRYNSRLSNISPLEGLTNLKALYITGTNIKDISPLVINIKNGGFSAGQHSGDSKGSIMILENKLDLNDKVTLENLQFIIDEGININYLPQN